MVVWNIDYDKFHGLEASSGGLSPLHSLRLTGLGQRLIPVPTQGSARVSAALCLPGEPEGTFGKGGVHQVDAFV